MPQTGRKILIVEDEVLIGIVLEDILDMLGHEVVANCATLTEGMIARDGFDVAILDVNIGTDPVFPLADRLAEQGIAIIFASGSSAGSLPERYRGSVCIEKPYALPAVEAALAKLPPP